LPFSATKFPKSQPSTEYTAGAAVFVPEEVVHTAPLIAKPKSAVRQKKATDYFENQIKGTVD
jgi:hypothetical protein